MYRRYIYLSVSFTYIFFTQHQTTSKRFGERNVRYWSKIMELSSTQVLGCVSAVDINRDENEKHSVWGNTIAILAWKYISESLIQNKIYWQIYEGITKFINVFFICEWEVYFEFSNNLFFMYNTSRTLTCTQMCLNLPQFHGNIALESPTILSREFLYASFKVYLYQ